MRISLLTDIHANREALAACLGHAASVGAERYAFLGDLIGYGADPVWVLDTIASYCAGSAICVLGNHDEAVLAEPRGSMRPDAQVALTWTRARLHAAHFTFLRQLPLHVEVEDMLFVHANALAPERWEYIQSPLDARNSMAATQCRYTFCGHVHEPHLYYMGNDGQTSAFTPMPETPVRLSPQRRWLAIPGAVGQPRDGNPAACSALFDTASRSITYYRVPYDAAAAAAKVRAAGLPAALSTRLQLGQ